MAHHDYHTTYSPLLPSFAAQLTAKRMARRLKMVDVAHEVGMLPKYYSEIERGRVEPTFDMMKRLANVLNTDFVISPDEPKQHRLKITI